jgi:hypothetical protein
MTIRALCAVLSAFAMTAAAGVSAAVDTPSPPAAGESFDAVQARAKWHAQIIREAGWRFLPPAPRYASPLDFQWRSIVKGEKKTGELNREARLAFYVKYRKFWDFQQRVQKKEKTKKRDTNNAH